ncbi:MAG TPA: GAF domain-containing protein, partial [Anaerolineales bacterium]|nr:GAF domain-containing protein [Anaerolineales bacterium]
MTDYTEHLPENKASVSQTLVASPDWELAEQFLSKLIIGQTTAIVFLIVLVSLAGLLLPRPGLLALWPLGGIGLSTGLVSYLLLRRGLFHPAVYTFLVGTCAAITFVLLARGYYDPSAIFYIWPILGAAAALNVRSGLVIATLSTLCYLIIVVVQQAKFLPPVLPFDSRTEWPLAFGSFTTLFYLLAYFTWLSGRNLSGALLKARQAHEQLEIRVGERTAELANANQELAVLAEARTALTRDLDLLIVLRNIVEAVSDLYPHTRIAIYFIEGEALVRQRLLGTDAHLVRIPVTQGIMGRVARTGQPVWLEDVNTDPTFIKAVDGIVSEICLPLFDQGRTAGVLNVESVDGVVLREADLKLMLALSENVGLAIGRARLYSEARESEARYRQQAANLQIAAEVAHVVTSILDIDRVLPRVVNLIGERFGYYHVSIFLNDPGGDATILRAASGEAGEELVNRAAQLPLARQSIVPWVCRTGQPYVTQDVTTDTLYHPHPLLPNTRAEAVFPLVTGEAVIGALDVESAETDVFTPETTSILATIANQIAIAVHNARLHANIKDRAGELEQAYQDIQEKHERLLISEKMASLGRLTTGIAHEIKTPLGAAQAAL